MSRVFGRGRQEKEKSPIWKPQNWGDFPSLSLPAPPSIPKRVAAMKAAAVPQIWQGSPQGFRRLLCGGLLVGFSMMFGLLLGGLLF